MAVILDRNRGSIPLTIATFGKVTALVCKTNLLQQIAVLDLAVSGFESHPSHQNGIAGFLSGKQGWHIVGYITSSILCGNSSIGRALAFQAKGCGFEPRFPLNCGCSVIFYIQHTGDAL